MAEYHRRPGASLLGVRRAPSNVGPQPAEDGRPSFELRRARRADMTGALALLRAGDLSLGGTGARRGTDRARVSEALARLST
jgi:hypothetical protein